VFYESAEPALRPASPRAWKLRAAMTDLLLFPFADHWWFYAGFTVFVLLVLALDLGVFHREAHVVSASEAAAWSVVWVLLAW
jgi:tellurite resistance protein TerC